jgi:hypothetical protein
LDDEATGVRSWQRKGDGSLPLAGVFNESTARLGRVFMGSLNFDEDSSLIRNPAMNFISCLLLLQEVEKDWLAATSVNDGEGRGCSTRGFGCNFYFLVGCPFMGDGCTSSFPILIKSNPFLKKKNSNLSIGPVNTFVVAQKKVNIFVSCVKHKHL